MLDLGGLIIELVLFPNARKDLDKNRENEKMTANGKIVCERKVTDPLEIGSYLSGANLEVLIY